MKKDENHPYRMLIKVFFRIQKTVTRWNLKSDGFVDFRMLQRGWLL